MEESQAQAFVPSDESPAQKQARLRRERREAKIKAGGSSRLDKITQLSGRSAEEATLPRPPTVQDSSAADPDEADISNHAYPTQPTSRSQAPTEADIRQLLRSAPPQQDVQPGPGQQQAGGQDDRMVRMLQQMMGGMPGADGDDQNGLPPGLAALLGGGMSAPEPGAAAQGQHGKGESVDGYLWKIIHAAFALVLGIYITAVTTFNGASYSATKTIPGNIDEETGHRLFWIFATAEVVLQSSRYFLEKGKISQSGWIGMVTQMLPEPWKTYAGLLTRYSGIWTTIVQDAMIVVFVLGSVAWWKGAVS
ncbi:MAG: hypothetical protein L6R38_002622 [Xanthoria sp. 2 TBL-2021]|nr:MAG: hypothetical protein L6R38_002622 [Xanthoria sp. 2 TBL-2021]